MFMHVEREVLAPLHFPVHFLSHHTRDSFEKGDPAANGAHLSEKSTRYRDSVLKISVGGKFRDSRANHENNEN